MEKENQIINYGFVPPEITPDNYVFGATAFPKMVWMVDGHGWGKYLPEYEPQYGSGWDTYGCSVWGTENAIEMLDRRIFQKQSNYSERFIYILEDIAPPGADVHKVAECIRKNGLIENDLLPMTSSYEEFKTPMPMTEEYLFKGFLWRKDYEFKHEWLWTTKQTKADRTAKLKDALRYGPVGVSVTAWRFENGVYVDWGQPNTHWCVLYDWTDNGWLVFDSYDQSIKTLSYDHNIQFAKVYYLRLRLPAEREAMVYEKKVSILTKWLAILQEWLGIELSKKK